MTITKKAAIYDPYLDTLGGGERYCLTVAEYLLSQGYQVDLFWSGNPEIVAKAQHRFSLNIASLNIVPDIFNIRTPHLNPNPLVNFYKRFTVTRPYDIFFYLSDGSVPFIFSKNNFLHVQVPFAQSPDPRSSVLNNLKLMFFKDIIVNSRFTQQFSQNYYQKKCTVLYPPVDVASFKSSQKEQVILSVGRFDNILNSKRQDILIEAFKTISHDHPQWKLVLAGGSQSLPEKNSYLSHLKHLAADLPVEFVVNPSFSSLIDIYSSASIYWHAAGYEIDQDCHPENTEHFGMTIVEAMASGAVPVAVNRGGIPEIITTSQDGFLWNTISELIKLTTFLIDHPNVLTSTSQNSLQKCLLFSKEKFYQSLSQIFP